MQKPDSDSHTDNPADAASPATTQTRKGHFRMLQGFVSLAKKLRPLDAMFARQNRNIAHSNTLPESSFDSGLLKPWQAYAFAVVVTVVALVIRIELDASLNGQPLLVIFTVPIMLSAYVGGLRAGLLATAISLGLASYYLLPPIYSFEVASPTQRWQQFFIVLAGVIISVLNEALHRARHRADLATNYTRSLIESNVDALMMTDPAGIISDVNQQMIALTGRTRDELIGMPCRDFFTDPARADEAIRRVLTEHKISNYELTVKALDGKQTVVSYNFATFRDRGNKLQGVFAAARDVTERITAETQLFESEAQTRAILAAAVDAIIIIDAHGTIESLNAAAEKLFGYSTSEMIGQNVKMLMPAPYKAEHDNYLRNYTTTGVKKIIGIGREVVGLRKNGDTFPMDLAVSEVQTGGRRLFTGIVRDITDRKRYERTLQEKNIELEHASRMKSEFLATMSHELRTPLNAIIGFSEALKDGFMGETSDTQHEYISDIFTSGQHLLSLINDILDLSKVEAGMMTLDLEEVDLNNLLSGSLSIIKEKAGAHRISLELEKIDSLGTMLVDVRKTKQILYNLLSNAVKFSANGGRIILRARQVPRNAVGILPGQWPTYGFPLPDNGYTDFLEISVSDSGIGISRDDMKKLFLAFSQIDSSLARKFEGTGLGLAMVKQLAELHGGTVAVASVEEEGAQFAAWLPLRSPASETTHAEDARDPVHRGAADVSAERIALMIEDDDSAAQLVRALLEAEGFSVLHAKSAEIALQLAPQHPINLITLDLQLPGIDGWEFLLRINGNKSLAHVPVVIIAGLADSNMALAGGAAAVLQKPVNRTQLSAALAGLKLGPSPSHTHTVLVVDDDPKAVEVIANFLSESAYAIVRAYSGREAIVLAQRLRPDLIVLDLMMPEISGVEVVEALQGNTDTSGIPVLIVTAKQIGEQERAMVGEHAGKRIGLIEKPVLNRDRLVAEIRRIAVVLEKGQHGHHSHR